MASPHVIDFPTSNYDLEYANPRDKTVTAQDQLSLESVEKKPDPIPSHYQDAFGDEENAEVKYKVLRWWQCGLLMVAETVSLGVLSLPSAVAALGLVPSIIILIGLGSLATYTGIIIGQFKQKHPHVHHFGDAGEVLLGSWGREFLGTAQIIFMVFVMASHLLTFTVAMNAVTKHATCSVVWGVIGMVVSFILSLPRTLEKMSWLSLVSFISILASVFVTMIAVGIRHPGREVLAVVNTDLFHAFSAVCNIVFAFCGHAAFFGIAAELKEPRDFPKAICLLQGIDICLYLVAAVVIYRYGGSGVTSPAQGSAGPIVKRVAYGIALPTILIAGVIYGHVAFKFVYVRAFRGTDRMHKTDWVARGTWIGIGVSLWVLAWIIAEAIPVFNNLLSLITALFASWFTFGLPGIFWLHMNWGLYFSSPRKVFMTLLNIITIGIGCCLCGLGLWVSGKAIHDDSGGGSFSCSANQ